MTYKQLCPGFVTQVTNFIYNDDDPFFFRVPPLYYLCIIRPDSAALKMLTVSFAEGLRTPFKKGYSEYDTKPHLMMKFLFWSSGESVEYTFIAITPRSHSNPE